MKNSKLMKALFVILVGVIVLMTANYVLAADDDGFIDLADTINNTATNNASNTLNALNTLNTSALTNNTANKQYTNTNLPNTGIEDSIPAVILITVFAISAVYAYKKVKDYKNI